MGNMTGNANSELNSSGGSTNLRVEKFYRNYKLGVEKLCKNY
jgi:hypothetical protein